MGRGIIITTLLQHGSRFLRCTKPTRFIKGGLSRQTVVIRIVKFGLTVPLSYLGI